MGTTGTTLRCAVLCSTVQRWCDERRVDSGRGITGTHQTDSIAGFDGRDVGRTRPKVSGSLFSFFFRLRRCRRRKGPFHSVTSGLLIIVGTRDKTRRFILVQCSERGLLSNVVPCGRRMVRTSLVHGCR
ncbi:hypothetical protein CDEST_04123 [Colletotrichum destructivum]|uniref:Secreted protein n=1 Tax=Colletotrichum destructivum TaxID=34406 RepID=A0AAX4I779_9PEZI|nr:hypothetical protein CDEST_04123 [Colletotrichum destructivum]